MHQLLLLRHAKSAWDDPSVEDHARPLNGRGRRSGAAMRAAMRDLGLVPDLILVSTARRTMETMALLEPWDDTPLVEPMDALYLAPAERILEALRDVSETVRSVLVIGHNPGLHEAAVMLAGAQALAAENGPVTRLAEGFPTGTLVEFAIAGTWRGLDAGGGRLLRYITPRDLNAGDD